MMMDYIRVPAWEKDALAYLEDGHHPPLLLLLSEVLEVSVEKVVPIPSLEVKDSEPASSVLLLPPPKRSKGDEEEVGGLLLVLVLVGGERPADVGGAVGSGNPIISGLARSGDNMLVNMMPMPSMRAKRTPPTTAAEAMAFGPARAAKTPPVAAPDIMEFHGSSFCRMAVRLQSQQAKTPPQTANCPPSTGPRALMALNAPCTRAPLGAFQLPFIV